MAALCTADYHYVFASSLGWEGEREVTLHVPQSTPHLGVLPDVAIIRTAVSLTWTPAQVVDGGTDLAEGVVDQPATRVVLGEKEMIMDEQWK